MKSGRYLIYTVAVLGILLIPSMGMCVRATDEPIGNETSIPFPSPVDEDGTVNRDYLSDLGDWFEQHFAFRPELVTADAVLKKDLFCVSSQESVITGKDNWLYYAATLDDFQHANEVSERTLFNEAHNVKLLQEAFEKKGSIFLFTIAPNKNTVCPDAMPERYKIQNAPSSDFERLIPYLEECGVQYVDLVSIFEDAETDAAGNAASYYARDSHWNETGAMLVYRKLMERAGVSRYPDYKDVLPTKSEDYYGDLGKMLYPAGLYPEEELHYIASPSWTFSGTASSVEDNEIETKNPKGSGSLVMYRDSFGNSLLPFFAERFSSAYFSKTEPISGRDTERGADVVIFEKVERHLPTLAAIPAMISGPERETIREDRNGSQSNGAGVSNDASALTLSSLGDMLVFTGSVDSSLLHTDTCIYVEVTDKGGISTYEAFTTTDAAGDNGYLLYLDQDLVEEAPLRVRIFTVDGDVRTLVCDKDMSDAGVLGGTSSAQEAATKAPPEKMEEKGTTEEPGETAETAVTEKIGDAEDTESPSSSDTDAPDAGSASEEASSEDARASDTAEKSQEDKKEEKKQKSDTLSDSAGTGSGDKKEEKKADSDKKKAEDSANKSDAAAAASTASGSSSKSSSSASTSAAESAAKKAEDNAAAKKAAEEAAAQKAAEEAAAAQKAAEEAAAQKAAEEAAAAQKAAEEAAEEAAAQKAAEEAAAAQKAAEEAAAQKAAEEAAAQKAAEEAAAAQKAAEEAAAQKAAEEAAAQKAAEEAAAAAQPPARTEVSRTFIEDCGMDSGYWDIEYSDGTHEYIDVP